MGGEKLLVFAKTVADFDKIKACTYSGSKLSDVQQSRGKSRFERTYHSHYHSSIIVPELMHNPHAGCDSKKEEDQNKYKESDGDAEDRRSPVALVTGHLCELLASRVEAIGNLFLIYMTCWK